MVNQYGSSGLAGSNPCSSSTRPPASMTRTRPARRAITSGPSTSVTIERKWGGQWSCDYAPPPRAIRPGRRRVTDNGDMPFAAVIFDFFGTLTPSTPEHIWHEHTSRSAAPLGVDVTAWRQTLNDSYAERATGSLGDLTATFRELARRNRIVPDDRALAAACAARLAAQRELFVFRPDALAVVAEVRARGLRVGVLSDCTTELAEASSPLPVAALADARVPACARGPRKSAPAR